MRSRPPHTHIHVDVHTLAPQPHPQRRGIGINGTTDINCSETMIIHQLSVTKWLVRAMFGAVHAEEDSTGGSAPPRKDPAPDHHPIDVLKARCAVAWRDWPVKAGTRPFKAKQWEYFYAYEDISELDDSVVLDPYPGQVKSIFLDDNQIPLSQMGGRG